jgi:hypothetical protein
MSKVVPNPGASSFSTKETTNVRLDPKLKEVAYERAKQLKLGSLTAYMEYLIKKDAGLT